MLQINLGKVLKLRGVVKPVSFLMQNGFSYNIAYRIAKSGRAALIPKNLERLCVILNCTPNDLLEYHPSKSKPIPENHSLNKLRPTETLDINSIAGDIPADKIPEFKKAIDEIKIKLKA